MSKIKLTDGVLTIEIPGLTAVRIDTGRRIVAVDGITGHGTIGPEWTVADLRDGTYGDFHRLGPADECPDRDCIRAGEHVKLPADHNPDTKES
jgi:hypothetical protein